MDIVDTKTRSSLMSGIRSKNTKPEMTLRRFLHSRGFRFRLHAPSLPGKPDLVLAKYKLCIFVNGCFWHRHPGCKYATMPKSNFAFWQEKLSTNVRRDTEVMLQLQTQGWRIFRIWECGLRNANTPALEILVQLIKSDIIQLNWPD
ncbi:very short patch repair endonuclease [Aeromonas media]|uniref:very short patch repair endonuclease n=1 Tax=Aeromonas media TaxID=651 RepID=UPI002B45FE1C|nr:very short patch repair endonuclease [Aeromonas media]